MGDALRVRLLGGLAVEGVEPRALGSRKGRRLLALLALSNSRPVATDTIAEVVWGDTPPARPAEQVSVLVSRLRQAIGAERLRKTDAGYAVAADWVDVEALRDLVAEAERRGGAGSWPAARAAADGALTLVRGPLLPEEADAEWCRAARADAERLAARARHAAATAALAAGDPAAAADLAWAACAADPYDEAALRLYLTACAAAGRPGRALAAYAETRRVLRDELGASPAPETEAVYAALLAERVPEGYVVGAEPAAGPGEPLPGRESELAALDRAFERVAAGRPEVVAVTGEAGIGKSRLVAHWTGGVRDACTVLAAACDELGVPFQPLLDALAGYLRGVPRDGADDLLGDETPLLGPLLGLGAAEAPLPPGEGLAQAVLHAALLAVVERLARTRPVVLVLDDAHLADRATAAWLRLVPRRASGLPLLALLAGRLEEGHVPEATTTLALGPLDRAAAERAVGPERAAAVFERSGGHPLFLVELAAAPDGEHLPPTLADAVAERCARAGGDVAVTLRAAAVLGADIDLDLLAAVLDRSPAELLDHLEEGARRRLLDERGTTFAFRHALVRDALAGTTGATRQALLHRAAARTLAARPGAPPLAVAHHARLGGDAPLAATALAAAADVATARFDYAEAVRLLDEALALDESPALRRARAQALLRANRVADGAADADVALAAEPTAASYETAALAAHLARDFDRALALADEGARVATGDAERASCLATGARSALSAGDLDGATDRLRRADTPAAPPGTAAMVRALSGGVAYQRGDFATATRVLGAARRPVGADHVWPVHVLQFLALGLAGSGRPLDALAVLDEQDRVAERLRIDRVAGRADNCRGFVLRGLGAFDRADDANRTGLDRATAVDQAEAQAHALLDLADGRLLRGDLAGAAEHLARAAPFQDVAHSLRWRHVLRSGLLHGRLALADGRPGDAAEAAAAVLADATRRSVARYEVFARLLTAAARLAAGEPADLDAVAADLARLDDLAGLEAWRWTRDLADAAGVDAWRRWSDDRLAALVAAAGPYAGDLRAYAAGRA